MMEGQVYRSVILFGIMIYYIRILKDERGFRMAGHSKWKNIQRRKNAQDAKRGKIFMKFAKDIYVAAKNGGGDPATNPSLRLVIEKAKAVNMPNENIQRAINKATGVGSSAKYEEIVYEGYGPGGVAVMVQCLTDNKNRTASNIRLAFSKNGGNLGESGSVSYMFDRKGYLVIDREELEIDEDEMLLQAIEAGAEEMETSDEAFEIYTDPDQFMEVKENLEKAGFTFEEAEITMIPQTYTQLNEEMAAKMEKLLDMLENDEDVQDIYHNYEEA